MSKRYFIAIDPTGTDSEHGYMIVPLGTYRDAPTITGSAPSDIRRKMRQADPEAVEVEMFAGRWQPVGQRGHWAGDRYIPPRQEH